MFTSGQPVQKRCRFPAGLITAWGFHAGLDACLCLVLLQMYTHFVPGFPGRLRD